ncbi:MAG: AAA family ATPase [Candidatus Mcinerneyibacterium aminivorans]|uniref:AAA family ATPase n=1 Tax=Candidatus Mcinerneyibacterium aminivorans TaxID=2703815 RepID=A0A5D0MIY9_9BACT|nr:MAG: AAA family ATPase [Candidatus Mcinerneyibacterium aminivorans]
MAKNIFIAATGKDVGKSTISFGIISYMLNKGYKVGFMKPLGQRWKQSKWGKVEEDVILIKEIFDLKEDPKDMNPIVIEKGYTEEYISKTIKPNLSKSILNGYNNIAKNNDYVIIEGTGHAGVGSVLDHSNAKVASILDSKVVLLAKGGIGSTIDELELNRKFFERRGVEVIGVIINQVIKLKIDKIEKSIKKYCHDKGLNLFGIIPYSTILGNPTLGTIIEELKPEVINDTDERNIVVDNYLVGASNLKEAINFLSQKSGNNLLVLPSDRIDLAYALPNVYELKEFDKTRIFTVLFSGNQKPDEYTLRLLKEYNVNLLWKKGDTFSVISKLSSISIKTRPLDNFKIDEIKNIVTGNINIKKILKYFGKPNIVYGKFQRIKKKGKTLLIKIYKYLKNLLGF